MRILVVNDDGINSKGILALAKKLREKHEVHVVAPLTEQSAVGHAITMKFPLRILKIDREDNFFGYAIDGTPADCIKIGIRNILNEKPDLVVSGINNGSNAAVNIVYSGTVSGAREATIMNIPAIAISVCSHVVTDFTYAAELACKFADLVKKNGMPNGTLLNINVPNLPKEEIKGIRITKQSMSRWDDVYEKRTDPYGKDYYWLTGSMVEHEGEDDSYDYFANENGYVSVTPVHFDLTDYSSFEKFKDWHFE